MVDVENAHDWLADEMPPILALIDAVIADANGALSSQEKAELNQQCVTLKSALCAVLGILDAKRIEEKRAEGPPIL